VTLGASDLDQGLDAMARNDWGQAYELLRPLLADAEARPEDLEALTDAAWWVGQIDDSISAGERAVSLYTAMGRGVDVARVAIHVAESYAQRLQSSIANGWMRRAARLLEGAEVTPELGQLCRLKAMLAAGSKEGLSEALELVKEVQAIGASTGDRDLEMLGLHDRGRFSVYLGDVDDGMRMMEDAMVSVVAGELGPKTTGRMLCNMIEISASMADYKSASEWSDQATRWCDSIGNAGGYPGACRVHRSEFMRLRGSWTAAEAEASRAADDLADIRPYQAQAFNELGMIHLNTGDFEGAEGDFRRAHSLGLAPMPGLAMLTLTRGDILSGWAMIESALAGTRDDLARAKLIPPAIEIALAAGMVDDAEVLEGELGEIAQRYQSELLGVFALQAKGRIAAKEGRFSDAVVPLREVVEKLVSWGVPYEAARARCDLGRVLMQLGSTSLGSLEINAAQAEFERLGARPELERISATFELVGDQVVDHSVTTMMFTDIVDSTRLIGLIGDEAWADMISWHDRTVRALLATHGGSEIDHAGDGFFVSFESAEEALACAVEIQVVLRRHRKESGFAPRVRIGLHAGEVLRSSGGLVGHEVHRAARVSSAAGGDEILVSSGTADAAGPDFVFGGELEVEAKGMSEPIPVRTLIWRE
jgi:class 3 adenylate cyclase